jgi:hypothetical protein
LKHFLFIKRLGLEWLCKAEGQGSHTTQPTDPKPHGVAKIVGVKTKTIDTDRWATGVENITRINK